jgi:voltage-gated potassium channel
VIRSWLLGRKFYCFIGLGGVHDEEPLLARRIGQSFMYALVVIAIGLLFEWQLQQAGINNEHVWQAFNGFVWAIFVLYFILLARLVHHRWRFVRENGLLLLIIVLGLPFLFNDAVLMGAIEQFRPVLAVLLMIPALRLLFVFFVDGRLLTSLYGAFVIVVFFGVLVAGVDPNIKTAWDGIWWAIATVSTVGYGDVVPVTLLGRAIGGVLVILGLGVFVVITANFLALILREGVHRKTPQAHPDEIKLLLAEIQSIQKSIKALQQCRDEKS